MVMVLVCSGSLIIIVVYSGSGGRLVYAVYSDNGGRLILLVVCNGSWVVIVGQFWWYGGKLVMTVGGL